MEEARDIVIQTTPAFAQIWAGVELGGHVHKVSEYRALPYHHQQVAEAAAKAITDPNNNFLAIAHPKGNDLGVLGVLWAYKTTYYFCTSPLACDMIFMIRPDAQGSGVARMLVDAYIAWARQQGCHEATLSSSTLIDADSDSEKFKALGFDYHGPIHKMRLT